MTHIHKWIIKRSLDVPSGTGRTYVGCEHCLNVKIWDLRLPIKPNDVSKVAPRGKK